MKTQFKDVAHLYLGCKVKSKLAIWELRSVSMSKVGKLERRNGYKLYDAAWLLEDFQYKPILRPLSDMTDEEIEHVFQMCYARVYNHLIEDVKEREIVRDDSRVGIIFKEEVLGHEWRYGLTVEDIGITFSVNGDTINHNAYHVTVYLLSRSFDLFNLIESGQAIDATTLTTPIKGLNQPTK